MLLCSNKFLIHKNCFNFKREVSSTLSVKLNYDNLKVKKYLDETNKGWVEADR